MFHRSTQSIDTDIWLESEEQRDRTDLQSDLNALITSIFREHPRLNYFQVSFLLYFCITGSNIRRKGYHDIVTVIFLTLPENNRLRVCEKLSLHRLRDAMGTSLEPIIALLRHVVNVTHIILPHCFCQHIFRILKLLLRLADKQFSELLER